MNGIRLEAYEPIIQKYAKEYGIPEYVELIKAVMMQESGGMGLDPMQAAEGSFNTKYPHEPKCFNFLPNVIIVLFSCTSKSSGSSFITKVQDKICDHDRCDHQLTDACVFMNGLRRCAHVTDNGMDLTTVTGVNRWKFAYQSFCCHAASRKDISGKSIGDDETKSKWNSCNLTWF